MRWVLLVLAACGPQPKLEAIVQMQGLDAATVKAIELFVVSPDVGVTLDCNQLLTPRGPFIDGALLRGSALVNGTAAATIPDLDPGSYFAVAHAYDSADGVGARIGQGCVATGAIVAGATTKITVILR